MERIQSLSSQADTEFKIHINKYAVANLWNNANIICAIYSMKIFYLIILSLVCNWDIQHKNGVKLILHYLVITLYYACYYMH